MTDPALFNEDPFESPHKHKRHNSAPNTQEHVRTTDYLKATDNDDLSPAWVTNYAKAIALLSGDDFTRDKNGLHKFTPYTLDRAISVYREMRERENKGLTIY